jgi:SAM-dependent methyltransferase
MNNYYWDEFIQEIQACTQTGQILLDAGAGSCHWKQYFPDLHYIGMDLGVGDHTCDYSQVDICGDLRTIPLDNDSVDLIISIQVLEHLPEPWNVISEFRRILKPGGLLFLSCPQSVQQHQLPYDFFRFTPYGLTSLLKSADLEVVWIKSQLGNFSKISSDVCYSLEKLPSLTENIILRYILKLGSFYIRQVMWRLHRPLFRYLDQFEIFQDHSVGHFLKAQKRLSVTP